MMAVKRNNKSTQTTQSWRKKSSIDLAAVAWGRDRDREVRVGKK